MIFRNKPRQVTTDLGVCQLINRTGSYYYTCWVRLRNYVTGMPGKKPEGTLELVHIMP